MSVASEDERACVLRDLLRLDAELEETQLFLTRVESLGCEIRPVENSIVTINESVILLNNSPFRRVIATEDNVNAVCKQFLDSWLNPALARLQMKRAKGYYVYNDRINFLFEYDPNSELLL